MEEASFDPSLHILSTETGNQQEHDALNEDQPPPKPAELNTIKDLPKEVGVMLITAGIVGFILPGPGRRRLLRAAWYSGPKPSASWKHGWSTPIPRYTEKACSRSTAF